MNNADKRKDRDMCHCYKCGKAIPKENCIVCEHYESAPICLECSKKTDEYKFCHGP